MDNFKQVTQLHSIGKHAVCFVDDDNYIYYKLRIRNLNQVQKLRCIHCNAVGTLELLKLYIAVEHDHDANISEAEIRRFKHRLRLHAIEDKVSFDEAYGTELIKMPSEVVLPTQSSMCANFYRIRNQQRPPIPVTAVEAIERAMSERYYVRNQRFFQIHINVRGKYSLIFLSPGLLSTRLQASDTVFLDGTFKIVPPMFTQLISIHFKFIDEFSRKEKNKYKRKLWNQSKRYEKKARYIECPLNSEVTAHEQDNSLIVSLPTVESTTRPMPENRIMLTRKEKRELKKKEYNRRKNEIRQEDLLYRPVNVNSIPLPTTGGQVTGSPFKYDVDSISCGYVTAHGPGLMDGITGEPCNFTIATNNAPSAVMSLSVKGPDNKPKISCIDNKDGTVSVNYLPTAPGEYKVAVKFAEKHISGSPYSVKITDRWRKKDE